MKRGRQRGWTKYQDTHIERHERLRRRNRCFLHLDAFTMQPYCGTHGPNSEWPCQHGHHSQLTYMPGITADRMLAHADRIRTLYGLDGPPIRYRHRCSPTCGHPYPGDDYVCGLHPEAGVHWSEPAGSWMCHQCGVDVQDTIGLA